MRSSCPGERHLGSWFTVFWVTPRSWEHWIPHYEAKGYRVLAPAYPGFEVEVEALNADPTPVERVTEGSRNAVDPRMG